MPTIDVTIHVNELPLLAQRVARVLGARALHARLAESGAVLTRNHLRRVSAARDGGSRFYESYARVTHAMASEAAGEVRIPPVWNAPGAAQRGNPLAAHYWGYTFTRANLTRSKYYTIPNPDTPESHYRSAREFSNLVPLFRVIGGRVRAFALALAGTETGVAAPRRMEATHRKYAKRFARGARILFWLVTGFKLKGGSGVGDKSVLPSEHEYAQTVQDALSSAVSRLREGARS